MPSIALIPIGVAAFASPRAFAEKFIATSPIIGLSFGISGKIILATGFKSFDKNSTIPDFSATFIMPNQKVIIPKRVIAIFIAVSHPEKIAPATFSSLPFIAPNIIEIIIKKYQI